MSRTNRIVVSSAPTSTMNITGFRIEDPRVELCVPTRRTERRIKADRECTGRADLRRPLAGGGGSTDHDITDKCSRIGPSARAGKKVSPVTISTTPPISPPNSGVCVGSVPLVVGTARLRCERAGDAERRDDEEEASDEHRQTLGDRVPLGAGPLVGERGTVVVRGRRVVVEHLGQAVWSGLEGGGGLASPSTPRRRRAAPSASRGCTGSPSSSRPPGSSCPGTQVFVRPSARR